MKLRDILPQHAVEVIEVRTNCPSDHDPDDTLFGYCAWDGEKLISLDGDSYFLDEEVYQYEWHDDGTLPHHHPWWYITGEHSPVPRDQQPQTSSTHKS